MRTPWSAKLGWRCTEHLLEQLQGRVNVLDGHSYVIDVIDCARFGRGRASFCLSYGSINKIRNFILREQCDRRVIRYLVI